MALPVLLGRLHTPQALLLWLALPPLLPGSPIPERCRHLIVSTISWALRLAGLALAPAKPHMDAMAIAGDALHEHPAPAVFIDLLVHCAAQPSTGGCLSSLATPSLVT